MEPRGNFDRIFLGEGFYIIGPLGPYDTYYFRHDGEGVNIAVGTTALEFSEFVARLERCVDTFMNEDSQRSFRRWFE